MGGGVGGGEGGATGMSFTVDGKEFDAARTDQTVQQGAVEEWTLVNDSPMDHPIHLHVWPMQITEEAGLPVRPAATLRAVGRWVAGSSRHPGSRSGSWAGVGKNSSKVVGPVGRNLRRAPSASARERARARPIPVPEAPGWRR